ncbi:MAG: hypothetical protein V7L05_10135 [Nostoc sp.]|uniref:hypothetical protein n=1 Tax=Nostoc sp. TaxID=1180 RepID=UPI002FFB3163
MAAEVFRQDLKQSFEFPTFAIELGYQKRIYNLTLFLKAYEPLRKLDFLLEIAQTPALATFLFSTQQSFTYA